MDGVLGDVFSGSEELRRVTHRVRPAEIPYGMLTRSLRLVYALLTQARGKQMGRYQHRSTWEAEMANVDKAITNAGAVEITEDGFQWVNEAKVGDGIIRQCRGLVSVGYAKGWL